MGGESPCPEGDWPGVYEGHRRQALIFENTQPPANWPGAVLHCCTILQRGAVNTYTPENRLNKIKI